ncbi:MAG: DUF1553 domain-containing protein [Planctomycetaceae bacterium]|nr:DUF1553 domain-containing protein [Planctomycetaceae bacterium]
MEFKSWILTLIFWTWLLPGQAFAQMATFYRGLNLNGPAVVIDGNHWEGQDAPWYRSDDRAFENQLVPLVPPTDSDRAKMIRSSRWGGNRIELSGLPAGEVTLFLYVWEDNDSETFSILANDRIVELDYPSGKAGNWKRLGPWYVTPVNGQVSLTSRGGAANFSGIEIWQGRHDGAEVEIPGESLAFFEKRIRPLLVEKCYACHSQEADDLQGEFLADSRSSIRRGGSLGPGIVPFDLQQSVVLQRVKATELGEQMPPDEPLTADEVRDLEQWIKMGAPDPRMTPTSHAGKKIDVKAALDFWSFRPIVPHRQPSVKNVAWPSNEIDYWILSKMESAGLEPALDADKRAWLRRVSFDLIGLPPTPAEIEAFVADSSPGAWDKVVDRLLDSPHYGERWARHWLDVVRYADTAGDNSDFPIPQGYRYRNWVIEAFNRDLPYDEFVRDQLAGDLRGGANEAERQSRIIATGYIAIARRFGSRVSDYPQHLTIEDTLDNLGRTFMGLSLGCARCHDHKFDPITARDYYGLYGIFDATRYPWPGIELEQRQRDFVPLVSPTDLPELQKQQDEHDAKIKQAREVVAGLEKDLKKIDEDRRGPRQTELDEAKAMLEKLEAMPRRFETAYAVGELPGRRGVCVQIKGDPTKPGDFVPRRFLTVFGAPEVDNQSGESGRRDLAEWLLADWNPLTTRVIVNRLWQHHFGKGLVPSPNDFGRQGKPPTHPELLDYLAWQFRQDGWSIKRMHRRMVLSRTYRQSTQRSEQAVAVDPNNDWLSGFPTRRLDAESIRDTLLFVAGNLDTSPGQSHPFPDQSTWKFTQHHPFKAQYDHNHRSIYLMTQRIQRHTFLATFDGADPSTSIGNRLNSTTPIQALYFLNDPFVHQQTADLAERIRTIATDRTSRVKAAYTLLFGRPPDAQEVQLANDYLDSWRVRTDEPTDFSDRETWERDAWSSYVRTLIRLNEFVYLD